MSQRKYSEEELLELTTDLDLEPDLLDIWQTKSGDIILVARGEEPADKRETQAYYIGFIDNGVVIFD